MKCTKDWHLETSIRLLYIDQPSDVAIVHLFVESEYILGYANFVEWNASTWKMCER